MKQHTKTYLKYFGYDESDFVSCETCNSKAVDIHHINCRGMGASKQKNEIDNLIALCRECHIKYGDKKQYIDWLKEIHFKKLNKFGITE